MKQLKFLKNVTDEDNKIIWHKDMCYQTSFEGEDVYMLFCEDMKMRGVEKSLNGELYEVICSV